MESGDPSAHAYTRGLKVACTIADLSSVTLSGVEGGGGIKTEHVTEAIQHRTLDRDVWA